MLKSGVFVVREIKGKTSAILFRDLNVGDKLEFSVPIKRMGSNRGVPYAVYVEVRNAGSGLTVRKSFNQLASILDGFMLEAM